MKCPAVETLSAYLEGELPESETALLAVHLQGCPDCREELAALSGLVAELGCLKDCDFTVEEQARLLALRPASPPPRRLLARVMGHPATGVALAVLLSFGAGFVGYGLYQRTDPGVLRGNPFQAFVTDHRGYENIAGSDSDFGEFNVQVAVAR